LCDLDVERVVVLAEQLGLPSVTRCTTAGDVVAAGAEGRTAVVSDVQLLDPRAFDVLVEATGHVPTGVRAAKAALEAGRHVAMVSKETESVAGAMLAGIAREHGAVHTTVDGDQPANLVDLVRWAQTLGLEVVAAGKASEYDVVLDHASGKIRHPSGELVAPELIEAWHLRDVSDTLGTRERLLASLKLRAAADHCEIAVAANVTGLVPDVPELHYPVARITELADVYALREHGGLLGRSGVVDVFTHLRRPDEASFAGGVFVVVRCDDAPSWELLAGKGHVVSADRRYACIYRPYHLMGVETVRTVLRAAREGVPSGAASGTSTLMAARTLRPFVAGELLVVGGHHHEIDGMEPVLLASSDHDARGAAPYYLAGGTRLAHPLGAGDVVRMSDLADPDPIARAAWEASPSLVGASTPSLP
jgi:predicted homoserine dehydrogenase-like protein